MIPSIPTIPTSVATAPAVADRGPAPEPYLQQLAPGVHAYVQPHGGWCVSNSGLVDGPQGPVVVDTVATERRAERLRDTVLGAAHRTPAAVVNTHFHGDHVFGNAVFAPAPVIAHERTRTDMAAAGFGLRGLWPDVEWGDLPLVLPSVTFRDRLDLHTGDLAVELLHPGPAHTSGDVAVWVPEHRVLFAGDLVMNGAAPYCLMGSICGSLRAVRRLRELDPAVVVPGHGPVGGPELLDATEAYLGWVRRLAGDGIRDGASALDVARAADHGPFAGLLDSERLVGNLHRAYAEIAGGAAPGAPIDVAASFREMVALHGGLPHCHA